MKKRLALLGLALIFIFASVLGGAFGPMLSSIVANAATNNLHSADVANYRIQHLPKKSYLTGDKVPYDQPNTSTDVRYTITRKSSTWDVVVGVSHTVTGGVGMDKHPGYSTNGTAHSVTHPLSNLTGTANVPADVGNPRLIGHVNGFKEFKTAGAYTYNFYNIKEYNKLRFAMNGTQQTGMAIGGESFHSYTISVVSTSFNITLPENDWDIYPNVTIPNPSSALTKPADVITPITFPLPKSMFDMKGRDLLYIETKNMRNTEERDARREAYLPELKATSGLGSALDVHSDKELIEFFFEGKATGTLVRPGAPFPTVEELTCQSIIDNFIWRDMKITFFGNENKSDSGTGGIKDSAVRTFIPVKDGAKYSAEYAYNNQYNLISTSQRTPEIAVERPLLPNNITIQQVPSKIKLETIPEMSFKPSDGSFRIGTESSLPTTTVHIHEDSEIQFDTTNVLTNYTYVAVRFRPKSVDQWGYSDRDWRWLHKDGQSIISNKSISESSEDILRINDFKYTPERVGEYQFYYYTTTIFGIGLKTGIPSDRIVTYKGREFIKNQPFDNVTIERDNQSPEIKWTDDFDYNPVDGDLPYFNNTYRHKLYGTAGYTGPKSTTNPAEALLNDQGERVIETDAVGSNPNGWGQKIEFDEITDQSKMLPGSTTSSKTKIAVDQTCKLDVGGACGSCLVVPAVLGDDNATKSNKLDYQLFLYRYQSGVRSDDYIYWSSGLKGKDPNLNGTIWNHNRTFHIPFTAASFNNAACSQSASHATLPTGLLCAECGRSNSTNSKALLESFKGFSLTGRYDILIRAYDGDNNISGQYQYTFEVASSVQPSRPRASSTFRVGQNEYHEGDTLRFNVATFTDDYTDDRDIEVRYYLSLNNGLDIEHIATDGVCQHSTPCSSVTEAIEVKDGENGMKITGGVVSVELKDDNDAGKYILDALTATWKAGDTLPSGVNVGDRKNNGFMTFRVYAVARNYHAITRGYEVGKTYPDGAGSLNFTVGNISKKSDATPKPPDFITAVSDVVTIFDVTYGAAATITDNVLGTACAEPTCQLVGHDCADADGIALGCTAVLCVYNDPTSPLYHIHSWYNDGANAMRQDDIIPIPALRFAYPTGTGRLYSTITYSITYDGNTRDAITFREGDNLQFGGGWQGNLGDGTANAPSVTLGDINGDHATQRYFRPMGVGEHLITIKVTNAGGNISVLVGKITIVGTPHPTSRLLGQRSTTMRIGESEKMPAVEITIDGQKYVTGSIPQTSSGENLQGFIVTADDYKDLGEQARVGTYTLRFTSESGAEFSISGNNFVPRAVGTYSFTYEIEIRDDFKYPAGHPKAGDPLLAIPSLDRNAGPIKISQEWKVTVETIQGADMIIDLNAEAQLYKDLQYDNSLGRIGSYYDKSFSVDSDEYVAYYNPMLINKNNFFTDMLVANTEDKVLAMPDTQLLGGLEPMIPSDQAGKADYVPEYWQYGKIYLPNHQAKLAEGINSLDDDFAANAVTYYTVTKGTTTLLDTRLFHICGITHNCAADCDKGNTEDNKIDFGFGIDNDGYAWFRPTGLLVADYGDNEYDSATDGLALDWAMLNATKKASWKPVQAAQNNTLKVDGEYVVTYTAEYMGVTVTKTFNIAMGDTNAPRITLRDDSKNGDKFTKTYKVDDKFEFDTIDLLVTGTKDPEIFLFDPAKGKDNYLANSQRNDNFSITIMTYGGQVLTPGDDHNYTINEKPDGSENHSFRFREPGTYYLTFRVKSQSGVTNTREYRLTVEEDTPKKAVAPETVWGTILIIASIGLFAGVIIYFFRTGSQTKFASNKVKTKKQSQKTEDNDGGIV